MPTIKTQLTILSDAYKVLCYTSDETYPTHIVEVPERKTTVALYTADYARFNRDRLKDLIHPTQLYAYLTTMMYCSVNKAVSAESLTGVSDDTQDKLLELADQAHRAYMKIISTLLPIPA